LQKAHVLLNLERFDEAVEHYMEYVETTDTPSRGLIYGYIGECYEYLENNDKAVYWYQKSLELEPESYDSLVGLGICMLEQEKYEEGMNFLRKAIEIEPEFAEAYVYLAEAFIGTEDLESALQAYKKSLEYEPNQPETLVATGTLLLEKDDFISALHYYETAYEQDRELEQITLFLAIVHFKLGNIDISMKHLLEAVTANDQALSDFLEICPEAVEMIE
jgi:Tfp pilus assembly protein PilF